MKLVITTTYENASEEWISWYLARLVNQEVLPGSMTIAEKLKRDKFASFRSEDPTSDCVATTTYRLEGEL